LRDWTAQADLSLQVVDTASIAPGATFTEPLPNGFGFAAGPSSFGGKTINAISQNFMVAAGANLGGQSQRIETMTFVFIEGIIGMEKKGQRKSRAIRL
jgi:hypothetical protein